MKFCNVNRFFQDAAAVDVEAGAVRTANVAEKGSTTRPCAGRHGRSDMVEVSGTKKSSLSASFSKPMMREASMGMPALERRSQKARLNGDDLLSAENIAERHFDELNVVICE